MILANETESGFTKAVIQLAQLRGWRTAHFRPAMTKAGNWITAVQGDGKGFPDLVLVRERMIVVELKVGRNKPTPEQLEWIQAFVDAGIPAFVWRPSDWNLIVDLLNGVTQYNVT